MPGCCCSSVILAVTLSFRICVLPSLHHIGAQGRHRWSCPVRLVVVHFFGFRGACARSDAIGPRSRFGVLGLRRSFPACDASRLDVVMASPFYRLLLPRLCVNKKRNLGGFCAEAVDSGRNRWMVVHNFRCSDSCRPYGTRFPFLGLTADLRQGAIACCRLRGRVAWFQSASFPDELIG
jgi:hypothetical protein